MTQQITGKLYKEMILNAATAIENHKQEVNELNVFPVPDGDTGTNMSLTIGAAEKALALMTPGTLGHTSDVVAGALLRGARGNSGVILSLLFRGFAKSLRDTDTADAKAFAEALVTGVESAYKAVMKPTEGTILTVSRLASAAAISITETESDIEIVLEHALAEGYIALANTINQNPVLKKAGVIDAGAKGYLYILDGMLKAMRGVVLEKTSTKAELNNKADFTQFSNEDIKFAYCTEFIAEKKFKTDVNRLRDFLDIRGDSVVVVDDDEIIKVHVHTNTPGVILTEALTYGPLLTIKIENMHEQHSEASFVDSGVAVSTTTAESDIQVPFIESTASASFVAPAASVSSVEPAAAVESAVSVSAIIPTASISAVKPAASTSSVEVATSAESIGTATSDLPIGHAKSIASAEPAAPTASAGRAASAASADPAAPAASAGSAAPTASADPAAPAVSAGPAAPTASTGSVTPTASIGPAASAASAGHAAPAVSAGPAAPNASAGSATPTASIGPAASAASAGHAAPNASVTHAESLPSAGPSASSASKIHADESSAASTESAARASHTVRESTDPYISSAVSSGVSSSTGTTTTISPQKSFESPISHVSKAPPPIEMKDYCTVVVCAGKGIEAVFRDLGADKIITGGQTMNPSTEDILDKINEAPSKVVFVLPNNKNIIMAAQQCIPLTDKQVYVIPTKSIPQGIAAMLSIDDVDSVADIASCMTSAAKRVRTALITRAARDSYFDGREIKKGEYLALFEDSLAANGPDAYAVIDTIATALCSFSPEFITIFSGAGVGEADAAAVAHRISAFSPSAETSVIHGGQPVYHFIISAE